MYHKPTRQWTNGKKSFLSVYGVKNQFAYELLLLNDIKNNIDFSLHNFRDYKKSYRYRKYAKYLEELGWKWLEFKEI